MGKRELGFPSDFSGDTTRGVGEGGGGTPQPCLRLLRRGVLLGGCREGAARSLTGVSNFSLGRAGKSDTRLEMQSRTPGLKLVLVSRSDLTAEGRHSFI